MYCVFTFCLYINVYKYMDLSIKWISLYIISHTYNLHVLGPWVSEEVLKYTNRINLAVEYHALE